MFYIFILLEFVSDFPMVQQGPCRRQQKSAARGLKLAFNNASIYKTHLLQVYIELSLIASWRRAKRNIEKSILIHFPPRICSREAKRKTNLGNAKKLDKGPDTPDAIRQRDFLVFES
jgi:hypothetical protein